MPKLGFMLILIVSMFCFTGCWFGETDWPDKPTEQSRYHDMGVHYGDSDKKPTPIPFDNTVEKQDLVDTTQGVRATYILESDETYLDTDANLDKEKFDENAKFQYKIVANIILHYLVGYYGCGAPAKSIDYYLYANDTQNKVTISLPSISPITIPNPSVGDTYYTILGKYTYVDVTPEPTEENPDPAPKYEWQFDSSYAWNMKNNCNNYTNYIEEYIDTITLALMQKALNDNTSDFDGLVAKINQLGVNFDGVWCKNYILNTIIGVSGSFGKVDEIISKIDTVITTFPDYTRLAIVDIAPNLYYTDTKGDTVQKLNSMDYLKYKSVIIYPKAIIAYDDQHKSSIDDTQPLWQFDTFRMAFDTAVDQKIDVFARLHIGDKDEIIHILRINTDSTKDYTYECEQNNGLNQTMDNFFREEKYNANNLIECSIVLSDYVDLLRQGVLNTTKSTKTFINGENDYQSIIASRLTDGTAYGDDETITVINHYLENVDLNKMYLCADDNDFVELLFVSEDAFKFQISTQNYGDLSVFQQ